MVFSVIAIVLIICSMFNFKKSFLAYIVFEMLWFANAKIISIEGLPSIPVYLMTSIAFFCIYCVKGRHKKRAVSFPYFYPLLFVCLARFASCFTSMTGFIDQFVRTIGYLFHEFLEIWMLWRVLESERDFLKVFKGFTVIIFLGCIYGFIEYVTRYNPIVAYKSTLTSEGLQIYVIDAFRGFRMTSFLEHPIGTGMTFGLYFALVFIVIFVHRKKTSMKLLMLITALLCLPCIFLTKMRAGILFTVLAAFAFIDFKKRKTYTVLLCLGFAVVVAFPIFAENINLFLSLFSEKARTSVGGSNIAMRFLQLNSAVEIMKLSPITGLGDQFATVIDKAYLRDILSFESVIFEELTKRGLLGLIANAVLAYYSIFKIPKSFKCREARYIALAYWLTYLLTSVPFFRMNLYYFALFYCIKNTRAYKMKYAALFKSGRKTDSPHKELMDYTC